MSTIQVGGITFTVTEIMTEHGSMFDIAVDDGITIDYAIVDESVRVMGFPMTVWNFIASRTDWQWQLFPGACVICGCEPAISTYLPLDINTCRFCR